MKILSRARSFSSGPIARKWKTLFSAFAVGLVLLLVEVQPVFAGTYTVPPYDGYVLAVNHNGKPSGGSSFSTTNSYLCPCAPVQNGGCTGVYGTGEIMEYKYKSVYSGPGTIQITYQFKLKGNVGVQGGSGYASVVATIGVYDSTNSYIGGKTIFSYSLTSGSHFFDGSTTYQGTSNVGVSGYQTYTIRWTVDIYSQDHGNTDFYAPFWFLNSMIIVTPSGGAPIG